jgi:hypothetical protein
MAILKDREAKKYDSFTKGYTPDKEYEVTTTESSAEPLGKIEDLQDAIYGEQWQEITERAVYAPTRFEYFVGLALQGLVTGRAERDLKTAVRKALDLAKEVEELLDSKES